MSSTTNAAQGSGSGVEEPRDHFALIVHTLVFDDDRLLLLRRANTGQMDGYFSLPGGHRKAGETLVGAAIRECAEEADIAVAELRPVVVLPYAEGVNFIFEAMRWSGTPHIGEPDRCDVLDFFPVDDLPTPTVPFLATALARRREGIWYHEGAARF